MPKSWERPSNVPFPSVWLTFQAKDLESDNMIEYRVQDMPEEYYGKALELMEFNFLRDEAMCAATGEFRVTRLTISFNHLLVTFLELVKDPVSRKEILECWQEILKQKVVLACFRENSDDLVGLNMVYVQTRDEKDSYEATVSTFVIFVIRI